MGRRFGQHYLSSKAVVDKIIEASDLNPQQSALEIGPGKGALTFELCRRARDVHAFEIDPKLAYDLKKRSATNLTVHEGDFLRSDLSALRDYPPWTIVANLPYYITAPILSLLFWQRPLKIKRAVLMMQEEVAQRICRPADRQAGALTYIVSAFHKVEYLFKVLPGSFSPPPRVDSAVVKITPVPVAGASAELSSIYEDLVSNSFKKRRKQLASSLRSYGENSACILERAGISPSRRPENLSVEEFWALARSWSQSV